MCVTRNVLNQTGESVDMFVRWRLRRVQKGCCAASVLCWGSPSGPQVLILDVLGRRPIRTRSLCHLPVTRGCKSVYEIRHGKIDRRFGLNNHVRVGARAMWFHKEWPASLLIPIHGARCSNSRWELPYERCPIGHARQPGPTASLQAPNTRYCSWQWQHISSDTLGPPRSKCATYLIEGLKKTRCLYHWTPGGV